jgi:tetratricopeptide (TPR) repeat protein
LASLGKLDQVKKAVEESFTRPVISNWYPAKLIAEAGREFLARGYIEESAEMYAQAVSLLKQRSIKEELSDDKKNTLALAHLGTQNLEEAETIYRDLSESNPDNIGYLGVQGIIAAKKGDKEEALRISKILKNWDKPYPFGRNIFWQAAITANLGEKERAVSLLQKAIKQGHGYPYCAPAFKPLWDYPPFIELLKPRQ